MNFLDKVKARFLRPQVKDFPHFQTGDTVAVHARISEGAKSRIQVFEGVCIAIRKRGDLHGHFRVRKVSNGIGVERVFPYHSPLVEKVELVQKGKSRRSKLYYLRDRSGKGARISIDYER